MKEFSDLGHLAQRLSNSRITGHNPEVSWGRRKDISLIELSALLLVKCTVEGLDKLWCIDDMKNATYPMIKNKL